jgi:hypothetical protein
MKIGLFYTWNVLGGWGACGGYSEVLARMGHDVVEYAFPGNPMPNSDYQAHVKTAPGLNQLNGCDIILSLHHEYVQPWLENVYNYEEVWKKIRPPIVARLDESMDRWDLKLELRHGDLRKWCSMLTYPAAQDAEKYGAPWIPHAVDTNMFRGDASTVKRYEVGFIGSLYHQRRHYLQYLADALGSSVKVVNVGQVLCQDLSGLRGRETMQLLAENYRQIKLFFCLPPISRLTVVKVFEVMACGTFVMCPRFPGAAEKNTALFKDGEEVVYYDIGQFIDNARQITDWLFSDKKREQVATAGAERVRRYHTYERMFTELLGVAVSVRDTKLAEAR